MFSFFRKKKSTEDSKSGIAVLEGNDGSLKGFKEKAQDQLQYLIDFMNEHEKDDELFRYAVKVGFNENEKSEHMWVQVNDYEDGYFRGRLVNKPNTIKSLQYGDSVSVKRSDVDDWLLQDFLTGTEVGGFSREYLRNQVKQK